MNAKTTHASRNYQGPKHHATDTYFSAKGTISDVLCIQTIRLVHEILTSSSPIYLYKRQDLLQMASAPHFTT